MAGYTVNSRHTEDLASGRSVAPGQTVAASAVDPKDPHDARLIEEGVLVPRAKEKRAAVAKAEEGSTQ